MMPAVDKQWTVEWLEVDGSRDKAAYPYQAVMTFITIESREIFPAVK